MRYASAHLLLAVFFLFLTASPALAWHSSGTIFCDDNGDGAIDSGDERLVGVLVIVTASDGTTYTDVSDIDGRFKVQLPDDPDSYTQVLDPATLPADAVVLIPAGGELAFVLDDDNTTIHFHWLIASETCEPQEAGACWLTGGGAKFDPVVGTGVAEHGPNDSMGGNVFPSCDPDPGMGGQWNHVAHGAKLHFLGRVITEVACGNVDGIEPGSESPVTPFNFIEFSGTGTLKGIKGNKSDFGTVNFFARCEDRNEPGSRGAKAGADIDRYFLHVFDDAGTTLLLLDLDGDPTTVDPVTITGGNLQIHISSCDDPPE